MSLFLVLLTLVVFIVLDIVKISKKRTASESVGSHVRAPIREVEIRFYHPGHSWVRVDTPEQVTIGVDDFAQRVIGRLSSIKLPLRGTRVQQGEAYLTLVRGEKSLTQVAPVSGVITDVNAKILSGPTIVNASPFRKGWIARITPSNLAVECRNLMSGVSAAHWEESVRNQLVRRFSLTIQPVFQDGGMIIENLSDLVNKEDWQGFVDEFFPSTVTRYDDSKLKN